MYKLTLALLIILCIRLYPQVQLINAFTNLTFTNPVDLQSPKDSTNRIFVVEQAGRIKVFQNNSSASAYRIFLDITDRVTSGGETGLLGLAFHPDFKNNGYFYVDYTAPSPLTTRISRFKVSATNPDSADKSSELILLTQAQPYSNHNGGQLTFGTDGFLYIAFGDGGSGGDPSNNAQNKSVFLGKILRIDVDSTSAGRNYAIPSDNPFKGNTQGYKEEIYSWGMRNPWRFSFDPVTNWLWCADVGQGTWEEIDIIQKGLNYGWRCYEGNHTYNTSGCNDIYTPPIYEYDHTGGNCSVTGGFVYRGSSVPEIYGKYIYADYCSKKFWSLTYDSTAPAVSSLLFTAATGAPVSFGVDNNKELYICSFDGKIYKFKPTITGPINNPGMKLNYNLEQNFPNPFNPTTNLNYTIADKSFVTLKVFDMIGNQVSLLVNDTKEPGSYSITFNAKGLSSGVYFYELMTGNFMETKKMVILK